MKDDISRECYCEIMEQEYRDRAKISNKQCASMRRKAKMYGQFKQWAAIDRRNEERAQRGTRPL